MKTLIIACLIFSTAAKASTLAECEKKIKSLVAQVPATAISLLEKNEQGVLAPLKRIDRYHLNAERTCGVELVEPAGILTVAMFKTAAGDGSAVLEPKKFETIILNGSDPTFTQGRVKALVSCKLGESSVEYVTRVPILTDGVKTPYAVEKLTIEQKDRTLSVKLRASVTPVTKVFRSITDCTITL